MTIKKQLKAFAAVLALLLTLCSCMSMEIGVIINSDGTGRAYTEMAIQKSALEAMSMSEEDFFEQVGKSGDSDSFKEWNQERFSKTIGGEEYTGIRYYKDSSLDLLSEDGLSGGSEFGSEMSFQREGSDLVVRIVYRGDKDGSDSDIGNYAAQEMMKVKFRISAPFPIKETNGVIDEDGSVYWDLLDVMMGKKDALEMTIRYDAGSSFGSILWIIGGILLAAVVIAVIILVVRNRPKPLAASAPMETSYVPTETATAIPTPTAVPASAPAEPVPAPAEQAENPAGNHFCSSCGARLNDGDTFCSSCGAKVN